MITKALNFIKRKDWKGYKLIRKVWFLSLFTIRPMYIWQKYPEDFYSAFEIDRNELCKDHDLTEQLLTLKYADRNVKVLMSLREMFNIHNLIQKVKYLEGDMAEVGVYQGGSAIIISKAKGNKALHLFDTFEGLPEPDKKYDKHMLEGDMSNTSLDSVKNNLAPYKDVFFYRGLFPDTAKSIEDKKFCFVNNDTDIYSSTKSFLEFFYPRMVKGGIILTHDYNDSRTPGVKKAFDEFFNDRPEFVIEIWDTQAYIVKA